MNCDWAKANITLYVYDELPDDTRYELDQHLSRCQECAAELKSMSEFKTAMSALPLPEPTANLLAASRMRLQESLESAEQHSRWRRWVLEPAAWWRQIRLAPAAAALLFIVGFGLGIGATYRVMGVNGGTTSAPAGAANGTPAAQPAEASVVGIRAITQQPGSNQVDIKYETLVPHTAKGSLDDPRIQQLLLFAARNNTNTGVRVDSVDLLAQNPDDARIREALMYALRYDTNAGVRLKALEGLGPYVKGDIRARDAVLQALMNDDNPGVRTQAIQLLKPVRADGSVRQVLEHLAQQDQNTSIRNMARAVLVSMPQID
ncbi:MAG: HEAT repeat domain-containing protein [Terriglobales bacterium]